MSVQSIFTQRLPELLSQHPYLLEQARATFQMKVTGPEGSVWTIDSREESVKVIEGALPHSDCTLQIDSRDLEALFQHPHQPQLLVWQNRLQLQGDSQLLHHFGKVFYPDRPQESNTNEGFYYALHQLVPDDAFVFMNHGYAEQEEIAPLLRPEDKPWRYPIQMVRHITQGLDLKGKKVLDIGCGRGGTASYLARYAGVAQASGLDHNPEAIAHCQEKHQKTLADFTCGDAQNLPFADESYEVITNIESSHCYPDMDRFYHEVQRVLSPAGYFCYTDVFKPGQELLAISDHISAITGLNLLRAKDITDNVALALERNRDTLKELLSGMIDPAKGNEKIIRFLINYNNYHIHIGYASRRTLYYSFLFQKPLNP